jgi:hypothetical protein
MVVVPELMRSRSSVQVWSSRNTEAYAGSASKNHTIAKLATTIFLGNPKPRQATVFLLERGFLLPQQYFRVTLTICIV